MIITIPWLKEHLKTSAKESDIINQLTNIGLEVESVKENSGKMGKFKIAKVLKAENDNLTVEISKGVNVSILRSTVADVINKK